MKTHIRDRLKKSTLFGHPRPQVASNAIIEEHPEVVKGVLNYRLDCVFS